MFRATIKCPKTGENVIVEIDLKGASTLPPYAGTVDCPACGSVHDWNSVQVLNIEQPPAGKTPE